MAELIPEPPDGAMVLRGSAKRAMVRDDVSAHDARRDNQDLPEWRDLPDDARWWDAANDATPPLRWSTVVAGGVAVERLYRQDDVDAMVAHARYLARADAGLVPLGDHLREPAGWCQGCGLQHSPPEWKRIEDQITTETGGGESR